MLLFYFYNSTNFVTWHIHDICRYSIIFSLGRHIFIIYTPLVLGFINAYILICFNRQGAGKYINLNLFSISYLYTYAYIYYFAPMVLGFINAYIRVLILIIFVWKSMLILIIFAWKSLFSATHCSGYPDQRQFRDRVRAFLQTRRCEL